MTGAGRAGNAAEVVGFGLLVLGLKPALALLERASGVELGLLTILANPLALGGAWLVLTRLRGEPLDRFGLARPARPVRAVAAGLLLFLLVAAVKIGGAPLFDGIAEAWLGGDPAAQGRAFRFVEGDTAAYLRWLALVWLFAAIGEELFFRGLLMPKLANALGDGRAAWTTALAAQALLFGLLHAGSGAAAALNAGASGLLYGAGYLKFGRSLLPAVIAHGLWDTFGLTMLYLGLS